MTDSRKILTSLDHAVSLEDAIAVIDAAVKERKVKALATSPGFPVTLERLVVAAEGAAGRHRLRFAAALGRLHAVAGRQKAVVQRHLDKIMECPLPTAQELSDPDERYYVGSAVRLTLPPWAAEYAAEQVALEDAGERVRLEFASAAYDAGVDLTTLLDLVHRSLCEWVPETGDAVQTRARRLKRILKAVSASFVSARPATGLRFGSTLSALADSMVGPDGPDQRDLRVELAREILDLTHVVVLSRFRLANDPDTYAPIRRLHKWFSPADWPDELQDALGDVADVALEAVALLARQGVTDDELHAALAVISGPRGARESLRRLARQIGTVNLDVQHWLMHGPGAEMRRSAAAEEEEAIAADRPLAAALLEASSLQQRLASVADDVKSALSLQEPALEAEFEHVETAARQLVRAIQVTSSKRNLKLFGEVGVVEEFNPLEHESEAASGARRVRIIRRGVAKELPSGNRSVVIRAAVEALR